MHDCILITFHYQVHTPLLLTALYGELCYILTVFNKHAPRFLLLVLCSHNETGLNIKNNLLTSTVYAQPFVKQFTLRYQTVVCLSVLSVMLVYCGQMVGCIKMKLDKQVSLDPGHSVRWGPSSPSPKGAQPHQFSARICCGQMAAWIKMPLAWS